MSDRVDRLIAESYDILADAMQKHIFDDKRGLAAICILYSGGNDSTILAHLFKDEADYAVHINTGIGVEATRHFVRETCATWKLPLIEKHPPAGSTYEELVIDQGFPGPGHHFKMYQRLKERGLRAVRSDLVKRPRFERVIFLAGRRRDESKRRMNIPECDRVGSIVFVSPLVNWTNEDMAAYRAAHLDVPRNEVSDNLHMSGECLCGAFAKKNEIDEIEFWYPETAAHIHALEKKVRAAGHELKRCRWGWGSGDAVPKGPTGLLCSSCDAAREEAATA